jgi:hypothetical protein
MPTYAAILAASVTGFFGALIVTGIGVRFTRNFCALVCSGVSSGAAIGALVYIIWGWVTRGFLLSQIGVPPLAVLILLVVMTAQNWFVFYEDREDVLNSSRPALVMLAAVVAAMLARLMGSEDSSSSLLIWAGAASWSLLLCVDPVQRSIERTRSVFVGTLVGIGKVLIPFTGIVLFLRRNDAPRQRPEDVDKHAEKVGKTWLLINLLGLFWDLGQLLIVILINGARVPPLPADADPLDILGRRKNGQSISEEMSPLKRDSVVMIFVLALHVLCGVVLAKA